MILYNVTLKVDVNIHREWFHWMNGVHIPDVIRTGLVLGHRMSRLLDMDDSTGPAYTVQYEFQDLDSYKIYQSDHAPGFQKLHQYQYQDKVLAFRTLMDVVGYSD